MKKNSPKHQQPEGGMAIIEDNEILVAFIEEALEHLEGIESDLLEIEQMAENLDLDFVNKVFRSIHSIKGGAGFLGLNTIKDLSHHMENLLNLFRNSELVPTTSIISVLLSASDMLRNLVNDYANSNEVDISEQVDFLIKAATDSLPEEEAETLDKQVDICLPNGRKIFSISEFELDQMRKMGKYIYLAEYALQGDIEKQHLTPMDIIKEIQKSGELLDSKIDIEGITQSEDLSGSIDVHFCILFATVLEPDLITALIKLDFDKVHYLVESGEMKSIGDSTKSKTKAQTDTKKSSKTAVAKPTPPAPAKTSKTAKTAKKVTAKPSQAKTPVKKAPKRVPKNGKVNPPVPTKSTVTSLRVNVKLLDTLMTLAGELVLTRNQLIQTHSSGDEGELNTAIQRVDLVTSELQEAIMTTRMQPIGTVFNKFQRVVRDLSATMGKDIDLIITGKDVDLDKTIIEAIGDPLTHLVRNAVDHGIETPEIRRAAGKPVPAILKLKAYHEAGQVLIEIEDDGAGIDPAKIKAKALESENFDPEKIKAMTNSELIKLIFQPGFSMAKEVTDISGRGVGMDVVHSNLTKLGGVVDIDTKVNVGTTIRIKLPLTLAIIPSLILMVENERYAIPQVNLVELVRIPASEVKNKIEKIDDASVIRLRGELLPLVHLSDALKITRTFVHPDNPEIRIPDRRTNVADRRSRQLLSESSDNSTEGSGKRSSKTTDRRRRLESALNIVVVNAGELNYGLIVNSLLDSEEIVVKPLGNHLRSIHTYAGATILGDGRAALILDVMGIRNAMELRMVKEKIQQSELLTKIKGRQDAQSLLIVRNSPNEQFAIPLGLVARIEKIKTKDIETTGGKKAIKYRGTNLLLLAIEDVANVTPRQEADSSYVIIFRFQKREVGIIVSQIIDVIDSSVKIDDNSFNQPGVLGSAIIFDRITLLIDLYGIVATLMPEWALQSATAMEHKEDKNTILIVEDSNFFLNQVKGFTEEVGYQVLTAQDGLEALETFNRSPDPIDLVLTDIEMPNLDGIGLTERIRKDLKLVDLPVIALTSVAGETAEKRAAEVGIDEYLIKLDREKVLERVDYYLKNGRG